MGISYNRLWKLLIDRNITRTELRELAGVSANVIAKMGKNGTVSMESLIRICGALDCGLEEIVQITAAKKAGV